MPTQSQCLKVIINELDAIGYLYAPMVAIHPKIVNLKNAQENSLSSVAIANQIDSLRDNLRHLLNEDTLTKSLNNRIYAVRKNSLG